MQTPFANLESAIERASGDFRSDVFSVPTPAMFEAMFSNATFSDDVYEGDDSVSALEKRVADMTGKEAALWCISGTQGNQICLRTHLKQPPHTVLCDWRAHVYNWESGAIGTLSHAQVTPVKATNGHHLTRKDVADHIIGHDNLHFTPTAVVSLENTLTGTIFPLKDAKEIAEYVRSIPEPRPALHLDGARLFDAVVAEGVGLKEYCDQFDSISLCFQKGLGCPVGSVIVGSKAFINRAKWYRKMFGGGSRQPGMLATLGSAALDQILPLFPKVHAQAKEVANYFTKDLGLKLSFPCETNMVVLDLDDAEIPAKVWRKRLLKENIRVFDNGRLAFHHQISPSACETLKAVVKTLAHDAKHNKDLINKELEEIKMEESSGKQVNGSSGCV